MFFSKKSFLSELLKSPRRKAVPLMTSPGAEQIGAKPRELFQDGALQFRCIEALSRTVSADLQVTFMDLSVEAEAFGCPIRFSEYENPTVAQPLGCADAVIDALRIPEVGAGRTGEVLKCARLCAQHLAVPTLGSMIGPYSLAGRLADMTEMMMMAAAEPEKAHALLRKTSAFLGEYLKAIKATGVAGVVIAEPAAGLLSPQMCQEFAADYLRPIIAAVQDDAFLVVLHNCGKTEKQVAELRSSGADALHVGNAVDIVNILQQVPRDYPVLGNLDPVGVFKQLSPDAVYHKTMELLQRTAAFPNFVLSSGCDLPPAVPMDNIRAFFHACSDYNQQQVR